MIWNEANNEMFDWRGLFKKKIDFKIQDETHFPFFLLVNTFWKFQVALCIQYNGGLEV